MNLGDLCRPPGPRPEGTSELGELLGLSRRVEGSNLNEFIRDGQRWKELELARKYNLPRVREELDTDK